MNIKFNVIHGVDHTKPFRRTLYQSTGSNIPEDLNLFTANPPQAFDVM